MNVLKVAAKSNPTAVAGALAGVVREKGTAELQAIGAAAINQAIKAIAIARANMASLPWLSPITTPPKALPRRWPREDASASR